MRKNHWTRETENTQCGALLIMWCMSVRPSLVNKISQERFEPLSSHLVQTFSWTQGWTDLILVVKGRRSLGLHKTVWMCFIKNASRKSFQIWHNHTDRSSDQICVVKCQGQHLYLSCVCVCVNAQSNRSTFHQINWHFFRCRINLDSLSHGGLRYVICQTLTADASRCGSHK